MVVRYKCAPVSWSWPVSSIKPRVTKVRTTPSTFTPLIAEILDRVNKALSANAAVVFDDVRGRQFLIPAQKIGVIEIIYLILSENYHSS